MNAISIGYRYTRSELSTLLQALGIGPLPGAPLTPVDEETAKVVLQEIADKELALVADDTIYVDQLTDCLLRGAAECESAVAITDNSHTLVLWDARQLYILGDFPKQGECALTPLQNREAAEGALSDALIHISKPLWCASVFGVLSPLEFSSAEPASEQEIAEAAMKLLKQDKPKE